MAADEPQRKQKILCNATMLGHDTKNIVEK
jgi:hypothetical protein